MYKISNFATMSNEEMKHAVAGIPSSETGLELSWDQLDNKSRTGLAEAFAATPFGVTTFKFSGPIFFQKTGSKLAQFFSSLSDIFFPEINWLK